MPVPSPPANAALPNPSFAAIAKALRRLTAMPIFSAISAWSRISLSILILSFSNLGYEPHLPSARPAVKIPVSRTRRTVRRGPSSGRRGGNGDMPGWLNRGSFIKKGCFLSRRKGSGAGRLGQQNSPATPKKFRASYGGNQELQEPGARSQEPGARSQQSAVRSTPRASAREDLRRNSHSADLAVFREVSSQQSAV